MGVKCLTGGIHVSLPFRARSYAIVATRNDESVGTLPAVPPCGSPIALVRPYFCAWGASPPVPSRQNIKNVLNINYFLVADGIRLWYSCAARAAETKNKTIGHVYEHLKPA